MSMSFLSIAVIIYCALTVFVVLFQIGLALGMPWGELAMGGKYPGVFPLVLRVSAVVQACLLLVLADVVLAQIDRSVLGFTADRWTIWLVVGFATISFAMNSITPSKKERMLWAPVAAIMAACAWYIAVI